MRLIRINFFSFFIISLFKLREEIKRKIDTLNVINIGFNVYLNNQFSN